MKYTVQTRYEDFVFDNGDTAMRVAELLANYSAEKIKIQITVERETELPYFQESKDAYEKWTGENMGGDEE